MRLGLILLVLFSVFFLFFSKKLNRRDYIKMTNQCPANAVSHCGGTADEAM